MDTQELKVLLEQASEAVRQAGTIIRDHWDKPRNVRFKGRIDLVTETDVAVEGALKQSLAKVLPQAGFLAEESAPDAPLGDLTWIIDPLDGTTNFAHQIPFVAISVALWTGDSVGLGMIHNPILGETYLAGRGLGASLNGRPIHVSSTRSLDQAMAVTGFPYAIVEHTPQILAWLAKVLPACRGLRRLGSAAMDLAYVACGRFDVFYEAALNPWDTAAGWLLVEEAGGTVTQIAGAEPFHLRAPTILAGNGHIHGAMAGLLA